MAARSGSPGGNCRDPDRSFEHLEALRLFVTITDLSENYPSIVPDSAYES